MFGAIDNRYRPVWPRWFGQRPLDHEPWIIDRNRVTWWWNGTTWAPLDSDPSFGSVALLLQHGIAGNGGPKNFGSTGATVSQFCPVTSERKFGHASFRMLSATGAGTPADRIIWSPGAVHGTGDWTIEMWIYVTSSSGVIYDARPSTTTNGAYNTIYIPSADQVNYYANTGDRITGGSNSLTRNAWHHLAVARTGTSTKMFVDGAQVGSTYTDSTNYANSSPAIGNTNGNTFSITVGYIDEVRVTSGVCRYTTTFVPPNKPFSHY